MVSSGSPDKGTAAPGDPVKAAAHGVKGAGEGQTKRVEAQVAATASGVVAASVMTMDFVKQYSDFMMGMLQGSLKMAQDYNAVLEGSLRQRVKADIETQPKPKAAEPPPVRAVKKDVPKNDETKNDGTKTEMPKAAGKKPAAPNTVKAKTKPKIAGETLSVAVVKPAPKSGKQASMEDLKQISGIGPKLEKILQDKGLYRFSDIASLTEDKAGKLDTELGLGGRILKDGWIEAAKALQSPKPKLRGA